MKKTLITLSAAVISFSIAGCSSYPEPKSVQSFEKDFNYCQKKATTTAKTMNFNEENEQYDDSIFQWINACMEEDMGWSDEEIADAIERQKMLNGEWGFDHDSMQP